MISVQAGPWAGAALVEQVEPTPRPWAMPLQRSSRFWPDWWITHRALVAPWLLNFAPAVWPARLSGWPKQVSAVEAARSAGAQPPLSMTTRIPAASAFTIVGFIRLGS